MNIVHRRAAFPLAFQTAKSDDRIQYTNPAGFDLLVQAALDHRVGRMGYIGWLPSAAGPVHVAAPVITRDGATVVALLADMHSERERDPAVLQAAIIASGLAIEHVSLDHIAREPLATTARVVWRQRDVRVDIGMRLAFSAAFADRPTMTVHELCSLVPGPCDPVFALMSLACEGVLHLDLSSGFDRSTVVHGPL